MTRGFKVGCIHGGMKPGSRDEPGTRLYSEQQFREGAIQVLVATEAAGEGQAECLLFGAKGLLQRSTRKPALGVSTLEIYSEFWTYRRLALGERLL